MGMLARTNHLLEASGKAVCALRTVTDVRTVKMPPEPSDRVTNTARSGGLCQCPVVSDPYPYLPQLHELELYPPLGVHGGPSLGITQPY